MFQLGFFNLSTNNTINWYLGIWHTKDRLNAKFWVANRDRPISTDDNWNLTLDSDGLLKIIRGGGDPIALNSGQTATNNSVATLENSGNFVLRELNPGGSVGRVLWESFDNPTDSLLPGMKLGQNFRTGKNWTLTSWLTEEEPSPGAYTLEYEGSEGGSGGALAMKFRGELYWRNPDFLNLARSLITYTGVQNYSGGIVSNENESYFSFSLSEGYTKPLRLVLDPDGRLGFEYGSMNFGMVAENECQGYSSKPECVKKGTPKCRNRRDGFGKRAGYFTTDGVYYNNVNISISDCWGRCWKDCDCVAFQWYGTTACRFWSKGALFYQVYDGSLPSDNLYVSSLKFPTSTKPSKEKWWIWLIVSAAAFVAILLSGYFGYLRGKKTAKGQGTLNTD